MLLLRLNGVCYKSFRWRRSGAGHRVRLNDRCQQFLYRFVEILLVSVDAVLWVPCKWRSSEKKSHEESIKNYCGDHGDVLYRSMKM